MGSFAGHILPGSWLTLFALHWIVGSFVRYYKARVRILRQGPSSISDKYLYKSTVTFPFPFCNKYPLEGLVKLFAGGVGIAAEVVTGIKKNGTYFEMENSQHVCIYFFFTLSGLVDVLMVCNRSRCLPRHTDYVAMTMSIFVTVLIFLDHGQSRLETEIHRLLNYAVFTIGIAFLLEMKYPRNPLCTWLRCLSTLVAGTWFFEIAFVLYNPWPDSARVWQDDAHDMMLITVVFVGHLAADTLVIAFIGYLMYFKYRKALKDASSGFGGYQQLDMDNVVKNGGNNCCTKCKADLNVSDFD